MNPLSISCGLIQVVYISQPGEVDFGLLGQEGEAESCASADDGGCAFSNPSSPYGLINLPLAPEEELARKMNAKTTPKTVAQVWVRLTVNNCHT